MPLEPRELWQAVTNAHARLPTIASYLPLVLHNGAKVDNLWLYCNNCNEEIPLDETREVINELKPAELYQAHGFGWCEKCNMFTTIGLGIHPDNETFYLERLQGGGGEAGAEETLMMVNR